MRVYIAGPISGYADNNKKSFDWAKRMLRARNLEPVSPLDGVEEGLPYVEYIKRGLDLLDGCEAIYLLPGWKDSCGARMELLFARKTRKIQILL